MTTNIHKKVLVDLDCLFDTRIACIAILSAAHAAEILGKGYFDRHSDQFWTQIPIDEQAYKNLYENRGTNPVVLEHAHITNFTVTMLRGLIKGLIDEMVLTPYATGFSFHINMYPHTLSVAEQDEMRDYLFQLVGLEFPIEYVRYSPKQLTPTFVKQEYVMMTMYDYEAFIRAQGEAMCKTPIREVKLYGPALYNFKIPTFEDLQEFQRLQIDPFNEVRLIASPMIDLELLNISDFSIVDIRSFIEDEPMSQGDKIILGMMDKLPFTAE